MFGLYLPGGGFVSGLNTYLSPNGILCLISEPKSSAEYERHAGPGVAATGLLSGEV
jgi:hypothetical protein